MSTTETTPTRDVLLDSARSLQGRLREFVDYGDTHRRTADEVIDALTAAGMLRLFTPRRYGGYEVDLGTLLEITEILGEADGSAAWLVGIAATTAWITAHASAKAQDEVFSTGPDVRMAGGGSGAGTGRPTDGGAIVTGRWSYASGSLHASWAEVTATLDIHDRQSAGMAFCLIPMDDVKIEDTWYTSGLRGTGSNTLVATDVFVPEHRIIALSSLTEEASSRLTPLYRLAMQSMGTLTVLGPMLGIGKAALAHVIDATAIKGIPHSDYHTQRESPGVQLKVADAALKLKTARLHAHSVAATLMDHAIAAQPLDPLYRAQASSETAHASQQILAAINDLVTVHGSGGLADANPLQRMVRDISIGTRHAALSPAVNNEVFGKALLGVADQITPTV